ELRRAIERRRVLLQDFLDSADAFDELAPVDRTQEAKAADAVADRHLVGGLLLIFSLDRLCDRRMRSGEPLLDPCQRKGKRRALALQASCELRYVGAPHRWHRARHVGACGYEDFRVI